MDPQARLAEWAESHNGPAYERKYVIDRYTIGGETKWAVLVSVATADSNLRRALERADRAMDAYPRRG